MVRDLAVPALGSVVSLEGALERAAHSEGALEAARGHAYLRPALEALARGPVPESTWAVLRGEQTRGALLPPLYDHQTAANLAGYMLSGLGHVLAAAFDLRGLLVLFDEVETAPSTLYSYERIHAKNLMRGFILTACDDDILLDEEIALRGGSMTGAATGLLYSGHLAHRYLYAIPSHLKFLFAVTPETLLPVFRGWRETVPRLEVAPLSEDELRALFQLTCELYGEAYRTDSKALRQVLWPLLRERVHGENPRQIIKGTVELLDYLRFHPGAPLDALRAAG